MTSVFFDYFKDAQEFAKESAKNKVVYTVKRDGIRFVAELKSEQGNTFQYQSDVEKIKLSIESETRQREAQVKLKQWQDESLAKQKS